MTNKCTLLYVDFNQTLYILKLNYRIGRVGQQRSDDISRTVLTQHTEQSSHSVSEGAGLVGTQPRVRTRVLVTQVSEVTTLTSS